MPKIKQFAFTLIELLVVIAVIGILSGLIVVSMSGTADKANIAKSQIFSNSVKNSLLLDMISEWNFDRGSVGNVVLVTDILDSWKNNDAVTVTGSPIIKGGSDCVSGNCIQFDGIDDNIDFGNKSAFWMRTGDHTVSFWTKIENATSVDYEVFVGCSTTGTTSAGYWIYRGPAGSSALSIYFNTGSSPFSANLTAAGAFVPSGGWYHVIVTMDRDGVVRGYLNGKQTANTPSMTSYQGDVQNAISLRVGSYSNTFYRSKGRMDEVRLFNNVLSASEVRAQYLAGLNNLLKNGGMSQNEYRQRVKKLAYE